MRDTPAKEVSLFIMMSMTDTWDNSDPYEYFMGRWSKRTAPLFLNWLNLSNGLSWLDLGCGTGALSEAIYSNCQPAQLTCVDPSFEFLEKTKTKISGIADFAIGNASNIPKADKSFDVVVSGLALNFFPDMPSAMTEMKRVVKTNGIIAAYVWDYADRMDFLRIFWDAAIEVDPDSNKLDEGVRFPICNVNALRTTFEKTGLTDIETSDLDVNTVFKNFEDYWNPFLGGQGPAGGYLVSLNKNQQDLLKDNLFRRLPIEADGSIKLLTRAIAVKGVRK
jgi:SAM-dependent methyltransferase